jgi:hypothetical protein
VTINEIRDELLKGKIVPYRKCRVCAEGMVFKMVRGIPTLVSCSCRKQGQSNLVPLSWDDLSLIMS